MRVPNLKVFIERIKPVLEERLAASLIPGYNGEIKLNFYTHGLWLGFSGGRLTKIEDWQPDSKHEGNLAFPGQTFLHLVFGHRDLDELKNIYPDCWWDRDEAAILISSLFPRKASQLLGLV